MLLFHALPSVAATVTAFLLDDWVSHHATTWLDWLAPFIGQPVTAVEIGSCEGRSACWFLDNILTHSDSRLWCVDPWEGTWYDRKWPEGVEWRFDGNVAQYGEKVVKIRLRSQVVTNWPRIAFGYVDGSHHAHDVARDGLTLWERLDEGGVLILDDYGWTNRAVRHPPRKAIEFLIDVLPSRGHEIRTGQCAIWK